jgi:aminoglycoside phosphotransferase (APT) family kinase protein
LALLKRRRPAARELDESDPPLCFCRSDPRFANVIARPDGRLGLVDWEDSGLRDPARDLADVLLHPNQEDLFTMDEWQAFVEPYVAGRGEMDPGLAHHAHLYRPLFCAFWLAALIRGGLARARTGRLAGWQVHGMAANERLRRYLARGVAWPEAEFCGELEALGEVSFFPDRSQPTMYHQRGNGV